MSINVSLLAFGVRCVFKFPAEEIIAVLEARLTDHSQALPKALAKANDRAWQAVGLALAGDTLFGRIKDVFRDGDLKGVRDQIKKYLDDTPTGLEQTDTGIRVKAAEEWHRLRKAKRLSAEPFPAAVVARRAATMERHSEPSRLIAAAHQAAKDTAATLKEEAPHLASLLTAAPAGGAPLLAAAFAFFFRREVETNSELAHGLTFDSLRQISLRQERGFAELEVSLGTHTGRVLDRLDGLFDVLDEWFSAVGDKLDELCRKLAQHDEVLARLEEFLKRNDVPSGTSNPQKVSVNNEEELQRLRSIRDQLRALPPELLDGADWSKLGDALAAAGEYRDALKAREAAAAAAKADADRAAEAENEFKRFRDACETQEWSIAAAALRRAVELDRIAYQPFDWHRYELRSVLGVGGFGVVFLCLDRIDVDEEGNPTPVAIKTLHHDGLDRTVETVFREARILKKLNHDSIIKIRHQDYAHKVDEKTWRRPYFVLEYFPGQTLETWLKNRKTIPAEELLRLARKVAEAVHAAHQAGVFHRDLKPANIMVIRQEDGSWDVRVIDFGLAVKVSAAARASMNVSSDRRASQDRSFAGTLRYAAPEQKGDLPGVPPGPYSDVYAFGRTCIECLFGTPSVQSGHWRKLPETIREPVHVLLERCVTEHLDDDEDVPGRFRDFEIVIDELAAIMGEAPPAPEVPVVLTVTQPKAKAEDKPTQTRQPATDLPPLAQREEGQILTLHVPIAKPEHEPIVALKWQPVQPLSQVTLRWRPAASSPTPKR